MREILFRGKSMSKNWVEGSLITLDADSGYCFIAKPYKGASTLPVREMIYNDMLLVDPETVGQFTGLTDKNGVKIFEGDIVKQTFEKQYNIDYGMGDEVEFIEGFEIGVVGIVPSRGACLKRPVQTSWINGEENTVAEKTNTYKNVAQYRCEVIGNIFDNPELMEGGGLDE